MCSRCDNVLRKYATTETCWDKKTEPRARLSGGERIMQIVTILGAITHSQSMPPIAAPATTHGTTEHHVVRRDIQLCDGFAQQPV